ncbi:MAG TPA: hypothetical protein VKN74_02770 [Candidatus Mcinerneyibacterium sp.]|nr:hypothetical protein [Candidatus Mcinerneyibacterium sp.]
MNNNLDSEIGKYKRKIAEINKSIQKLKPCPNYHEIRENIIKQRTLCKNFIKTLQKMKTVLILVILMIAIDIYPQGYIVAGSGDKVIIGDEIIPDSIVTVPFSNNPPMFQKFSPDSVPPGIFLKFGIDKEKLEYTNDFLFYDKGFYLFYKKSKNKIYLFRL